MFAHRIIQGNLGWIDKVVAIFVEDGVAFVQELFLGDRVNGAEEPVDKFLHEHLHAVGEAGHVYDHLVGAGKCVVKDAVFLQLVAHAVRVLANHVFHEMRGAILAGLLADGTNVPVGDIETGHAEWIVDVLVIHRNTYSVETHPSLVGKKSTASSIMLELLWLIKFRCL